MTRPVLAKHHLNLLQLMTGMVLGACASSDWAASQLPDGSTEPHLGGDAGADAPSLLGLGSVDSGGPSGFVSLR